jgi:hypothetical protein
MTSERRRNERKTLYIKKAGMGTHPREVQGKQKHENIM